MRNKLKPRKLCWYCNERADVEEVVNCEDCGGRFHRDCYEYHMQFDSNCGDDKWVGALEF
ncbi:MAG: hypothetical protein SXQ77_13135 [Halobacteria archaeon]|nr:hypothetical protein [Halobacteria archaeon]